MEYLNLVIIFIFISCGFGVNAQTNNLDVQRIKALNLSGVTITEIQNIQAGNFTLPDGKLITNLPAFIKVSFISKPTSESNIKCEIWMPVNNWNGRFLGTGNGGGAGHVNYSFLTSGVMRGFATANTDMGTSPNVLHAIGHPEIWADFGFRATHEMTIISKIILQAYYKKHAKHSYFFGASTGGQQALMESQLYPNDYDGIVAGAPANNRTHLHASFIWNLNANIGNTGEKIISPQKMDLLSKLILKQCDDNDGGAPNDDFLTDPRMCKFNPEMLPHCTDNSVTDSCFTNEEIDVLKKIYTGPVNPKTGKQIFSPLPIGGNHLVDTSPHLYIFKWVFGDDFDYTKFDFDLDMAKIDSILGPVLNANNPHLEQLKNRGGKIIMYAGTDDQLIPFQDAVSYYERVIDAQHSLAKTQSFFRFFIVPGLGHVGGGIGLTNFGQRLQDTDNDILTAMINWVENGTAPNKFIASGYDKVNKDRFERPVFPYPIFPKYIGGNSNLSSSYKGINHLRNSVMSTDKKFLK